MRTTTLSEFLSPYLFLIKFPPVEIKQMPLATFKHKVHIVNTPLSDEKFSVDDICKIIGVSRIQLYRKVKALMGCNIADYILNRRLLKAKHLLNNENLTIAEITYRIGFANPNYFATVFKAKYGCTPSEFKRNKIEDS